ncbi:hsp90-like protein [Diplocarpon mali]|nr:hsp90-like protein [Diplocarpon mali]
MALPELKMVALGRCSKPELLSSDISFPHVKDPRCRASSDFSNCGTLNNTTDIDTDEAEAEAEGIPFPEGGSGWLVVVGAWCVLFPSLGIMNTMGAFEEYISTHQLKDYGLSAVGWIFSLYAFLTFGVGLFVGPVFDKFGPRWLILSGSVLLVSSMCLVGYCTGELLLPHLPVLGGVGAALVFSPSITVIGHYFSRRRGIATGIATTGGAFGGILFPIILQACLPKIGFLWATKVIALISLVLCLLANLLITARITSGKSSSARPDLRILGRPAFAVTVLGVFLLEFALFVPLTYINSYCTAKGFSQSFSALVLPVLNVGSVFGRLLPGYVADRFNIAIVAILLTVVSVLAVWLPFGGSKAGIIVFTLLFGFGSGSNISLTPTLENSAAHWSEHVSEAVASRSRPASSGRYGRSYTHNERKILKMRVGIREQLGAVILLTSLVPLAVLSIAVWINNKDFVVNITSQDLSLTASLKASQIASNLALIQATCATIVSRIVLNSALKSYYRGDDVPTNWTSSLSDIGTALDSGGYSSLLQITVFSRNSTTGENGSENSSNVLLRATAPNTGIVLTTKYSNGSNAMLGDDSDLGYPMALYPNITYTKIDALDPMDPSVSATRATAFSDFPLNRTSQLLLGPVRVNDSYALLSLTLPITDNSNKSNVLAYMTVVAAATSLISVIESREGLAKTGIALLVGPSRRENLFRYEQRPSNENYAANPDVIGEAIVKFVFDPPANHSDRHKKYLQNLTDLGSSNFSLKSYPAAVDGFASPSMSANNAGSELTTRNEQGDKVAVGYARPDSSLVSWLLIIEQTHAEAWSPIETLRTIVLACVFGTVGLILIVVFPMAHYGVRPIRRLRDATEKSIAPPGYTPNGSIRSDRDEYDCSGDESGSLEHRNSDLQRSKKGFFMRLKNLTPVPRRKTRTERHEDERRRVFKIPGKVRDRKHFVTDELTELTCTFNDMSDELLLQYSNLERKVLERTAELEISKRAAEAANESKTLFIANISHELKTPLNGILGMCAVCMGEDDLPKIKRSLGIVYKSGDLLLHLLNDLLLFSKNQIGQQLSLEEKDPSQPVGTALLINPMDPKATSRLQYQERPQTPPPPNSRTLVFQFEVEDTGPGIPEQLKDRVFEPFVQGDLGLSKKYGGTGLGLSICSQLAGLMGGNITLADVEPHGSIFTMRLPLKHIKSRAPSISSSDVHGSKPPSTYSNDGNRPTSKISGDASPNRDFEKDSQPRLVGLSQPFFASASPHSATPCKDSKNKLATMSKAALKEPGSKFRVLVAEDNLINIEIVLRMLKLEDIYDVVVAKDGQEAYDQVKESMSRGEYFDLIFMDVQMPNLDGLQSTRLIRQMGYSAPIVALTAFAEESNVKDCYDSGMDMFLSKPIRRPALKQILKKFATIPEETESPTETSKSSSSPPGVDTSAPPSKKPGGKVAGGSSSPPL